MASVDQPFQPADSEDQNNQTTANSSVTQPQIAGGGSAPNAPGAAAGAPKGQLGGTNPAATTSGTYPNLEKYMQANQGWNSSQGGLGGEIASNIGQQGNQVQQSLQNAQQSFENQGNNWESGVNTANQGFQQGLTNLTGYLQNNSNAEQQANTALNASYTGAQNLDVLNPNLGQQVQNYANTASQGQTEAGRYNLLQQMFGNNNYNQGEQSLDQALIENSPTQLQSLQGAQQQAQQTNLNYQNSDQSAQAQAQAWQNFANNTQQQARGALNTAITNEGQNIQNEYQNALTQQQQTIAALNNSLANGQINQAAVNELGLQPLIGQDVYNVNLGSYVNPVALNAQNTATAQDYAAVNALNQLSGNPNVLNSAASQVLSQYQNQPTTLYNSTNDLGFNLSGAQQAIQTAQQAYNEALQTPYSWSTKGIEGILNSNLGNPYGGNQGIDGNVLLNPATAQGATWAQLGIGPGSSGDTSNNGMGGVTPLGQLMTNYYAGQGYQTGMEYSPQQQAQINALQNQISAINAASNGNSGGNFQLTNLQNQLAQAQQGGQEVITAPNFYTTQTPIQFYQALINGQVPGVNASNVASFLGSSAAGGGTNLAINALEQLMNLNQQYDPTRTLQVTPSS